MTADTNVIIIYLKSILFSRGDNIKTSQLKQEIKAIHKP